MASQVFFTSIPKCGKNLIYSLFHGLGYARHFPSTEDYAEAAYAAAFTGINYAYSPRTEGYPPDVFRGFAAELAAMPERSVFHRHLLPRPEFREMLQAAGVRALFVVRDPRDAVVSAANYARAQGKPVQIAHRMEGLDIGEMLRFLLTGADGTAPFLDQFDAFRAWVDWEEVMTVRFEDLVGARGGGDDTRQKNAVEAILHHAGIAGEAVATAMDSVFNPRAGTFFRGQIGSHKDVFDPALTALFEERHGHLLDQWGYR